MQKSDFLTSHAIQLGSPSYADLYAQFAHVFSVKRGDINAPAANIDGVRLGKDLIFAPDGEGMELYTALNHWLANPSLENLTEVADGAADLIYVVLQLCWALDIPIDRCYQAVHNNNMTKVQPDGTVLRRPDGKVLKPVGYVPVNLWEVLHKYSNERAKATQSQGADNWPDQLITD